MDSTFMERKNTHLPKVPYWRTTWQRWVRFPKELLASGSYPLLLFTALNEMASNLVFVSLLETAYIVGRGASSVGAVLIIQSIAQLLLGSGAGVLVDRLGTRKAATIGTISQAGLTVGLIFSRSVPEIYVLAFFLMFARLLIIPARLAIVNRISNRKKLVRVNTALEALIGAGLFLGPAIGAMLILLTHESMVPPMTASLIFLVSALPSLLLKPTADNASNVRSTQQRNIFKQMWTTIGFIRNHRMVWLMLLCLVHSTMTLAAMMPLLTPLARKFGFGNEGTSLLIAALGLGNMVGPVLAPALFKRFKISSAMLLTGLASPLAILAIGIVGNIPAVGVLALLAAVTFALVCLRVIVNTVLQRLTPKHQQGRIFGAEQGLLGLGWIISLAVMTGISTIIPGLDVRVLILFIGGVGLLIMSVCWAISRREIQTVCNEFLNR